MISIVNLSSPGVKVYLFSLLADLEIYLATIVTRYYTDAELQNLYLYPEDPNPQTADIRRRYMRDKKNNIERPFLEYLYLRHLVERISCRRLFTMFGFEDSEDFEDKFKALCTLRNQVAHPARSFITGPGILPNPLGADRFAERGSFS